MNKKFVIYDATGAILRTGDCPESDWQHQAKEGEFIIEAEACCVNDAVCPHTHVVLEGAAAPQEPIVQTPTGPRPMSTDTKLDLLWQAMDAGTFPKAEPFYSAIKAQKGLS